MLVATAIRLGEAYHAALSDTYRVVPVESLGAERASVRALVTMGTVGASAALMDTLPALGLIVCVGSGVERVDLAEARRRGVLVANSRGANAACVADLAMGLVIATVRRMSASAWSTDSAGIGPLAPGLGDLRLGVLGLGDIGRRIARRAEAFEMEVGYCTRMRRNDVPYPYFTSALALATWSDVLVIALRAEAAHRHLVDAAVLDALGPGGYLVNVARGFVVDEAALAAALASGRLAGAGLDVLEDEPNVPDALRSAPNVVITPHIGGATGRAHRAMAALVRRNLDAFAAGAPLATPWVRD